MNESENYSANYDEEEARRFFFEGYEKQNRGELDEAIELYKKSLDVRPTAEAYTFLGWAYSMKGHFDEAIIECHRAIEVDPDFGNPYNDIGAYLIEKGKFDDAISWLEKATQAKRYDAYCYPYYNLGRIWEQKGDWMRAREYYRQSLNANSNYVLAARALRRVEAMMN